MNKTTHIILPKRFVQSRYVFFFAVEVKKNRGLMRREAYLDSFTSKGKKKQPLPKTEEEGIEMETFHLNRNQASSSDPVFINNPAFTGNRGFTNHPPFPQLPVSTSNRGFTENPPSSNQFFPKRKQRLNQKSKEILSTIVPGGFGLGSITGLWHAYLMYRQHGEKISFLLKNADKIGKALQDLPGSIESIPVLIDIAAKAMGGEVEEEVKVPEKKAGFFRRCGNLAKTGLLFVGWPAVKGGYYKIKGKFLRKPNIPTIEGSVIEGSATGVASLAPSEDSSIQVMFSRSGKEIFRRPSASINNDIHMTIPQETWAEAFRREGTLPNSPAPSEAFTSTFDVEPEGSIHMLRNATENLVVWGKSRQGILIMVGTGFVAIFVFRRIMNSRAAKLAQEALISKEAAESAVLAEMKTTLENLVTNPTVSTLGTAELLKVVSSAEAIETVYRPLMMKAGLIVLGVGTLTYLIYRIWLYKQKDIDSFLNMYLEDDLTDEEAAAMDVRFNEKQNLPAVIKKPAKVPLTERKKDLKTGRFLPAE